MGTTTKGLPYPSQSDDPNVPGDIQALAAAVDALLTSYLTSTGASALYATLAATYSRTVMDGRTPATSWGNCSRIHFGQVVDTPGAGGSLTIAHGAGFTPTRIMAVAADTDAAILSANGLTCNVANDSIGATNFGVRVMKNNGSGHNQSCWVTYICTTV